MKSSPKPFIVIMSAPFILGFALALICLPLVHAQTTASAPTAASPSPSGKAPDEVMKRLSDLVHAGKYAEAQQLTTGLLLAYPSDQRLIKAKALLDKSLAAGAPVTSPDSIPQANNAAPVPLATDTTAAQLTGMDKVDYNALILMARQAQQNADLEQQKTSLKQFMDQSGPFLQKHPDQMLLWQLRAASAISLNDPMAGYDAGQKLLAAGAADTSDPKLQQLVAELKNKGWLDEKEATKQGKYTWILGIWSGHCSINGHEQSDCGHWTGEFAMSDSVIEGFPIINGTKQAYYNYKATIADSGEIRFEPTSCLRDGKVWPASLEIDDHNQTVKIVESVRKDKYTYVLHKK